MVNMKNACTTAAFFMEGLHDAGYDECIYTYGQGCVEMVEELSSYAIFSEKQVSKYIENNFDFPGVFDYEVSAPFGKWWGQWLLENESTPPEHDCEQRLKEKIKAFFEQGLGHEAERHTYTPANDVLTG